MFENELEVDDDEDEDKDYEYEYQDNDETEEIDDSYFEDPIKLLKIIEDRNE
ncbi:hypothetical protein MHI37_04655 [Paenibacillus sp. FSL H8-0548]|uniref:hypothetical protein n=1 Tax=Paenibacillus sp. FSL H8-0548 TaxID=1920422 RepID=UPI0015C3EE2F|nr:hypothetical protein [Paenibacillus sp. FSL H8-0548]